MSKYDRFQTPYHQNAFPDPQNKVEIEYSVCAGCGEIITNIDVDNEEILNVFGMCVHDTYNCLKQAVNAKTIEKTE